MLAAAFLLCAPASVRAESLIVEYFTLLGPADAWNSRGQRLDELCAIVQQDRANWHRFGNREQGDGGDPFFNTSERRARIAGKCAYDRSYYADAGARIRSGSRHFYVYVRVFGTGDRISRVVIAEGAG
ncbi:hypothetical protein M4578_02100 [Salipiger sp. P9]|uniref:hypothetical protein n=1 Tax=Salipiger pentaromativorans TaxID=2943193 RepID=UPI0021571CB5|nr:hypothetical protein [Salipiger pentaromativorans]